MTTNGRVNASGVFTLRSTANGTMCVRGWFRRQVMSASTVPRVGEPGCIVAQTAPPLERPLGRNHASTGHEQPQAPTLRTTRLAAPSPWPRP